MLDNTTSDGSPASGSLYAWWLNALPAFFEAASASKPDASGAARAAAASTGAATPSARTLGTANAAAGDASAGLGPVPDALDMARRLLTPLYEASLKALLAHPQPGMAFGDLLEQARTALSALSDSLTSFRQGMPAQPWMPWLGGGPPSDPLAAIGGAMSPLVLNLERAYGGLADAFGLAPSRELQQAMRELMAGTMARRQAQAQYLAIVATALAKGIDGTLARLREMGKGGESVDSLLALTRVWARSTDEAVHAAMQSPDALDASARLLRASTGTRQQLQRVVGIVSATLSVPTRAEVDDAYREIQELKREVRRLRKASPLASAAPLGRGDAQAANGSAARKRPTPANAPKAVKATRAARSRKVAA